ncbi:MAG: pyridoxal phosphate-dependent aminotransferase [Flavobacteriales bacterium]|nr:pyridoxal phosphate-dependent aminotransferase [Flavobacteriales bacterium]
MKINKSGAEFSSIVSIGENLKKLSQESGLEYIYLNRGVNAVCSINLTPVISRIDFNSTRIQNYPPNSGFIELREAINKNYFNSLSKSNKISIAPGGMACLDLILKTLDLENLYYNQYYWGSYRELGVINKLNCNTYKTLDDIKILGQNSAILICDPSNPVGNKYDDEYIFNQIERMANYGGTIIFDCPYRRLFIEDNEFYTRLLKYDNVIITESFSKCMGLSGQRIGFIHSNNEEFNKELDINILYSTNGVNAFAQELVLNLLDTEQGYKEVLKFREVTAENIKKNLEWLSNNDMLYDELYKDSSPLGIFAIVNINHDKLTENRIGSVPLSHFCDIDCPDYSRICVSIPHNKFVEFFSKIKNKF